MLIRAGLSVHISRRAAPAAERQYRQLTRILFWCRIRQTFHPSTHAVWFVSIRSIYDSSTNEWTGFLLAWNYYRPGFHLHCHLNVSYFICSFCQTKTCRTRTRILTFLVSAGRFWTSHPTDQFLTLTQKTLPCGHNQSLLQISLKKPSGRLTGPPNLS